MNLTSIMVSLLIFSGITIGMIGYYTNLATTYSVNFTNPKIQDSTAQVNELTTDIKNRTSSLSKGWTLTNLQDPFFLILDTVKSFLVIPNILTGMAEDLSNPVVTGIPQLVIPSWFTNMIKSIIVVVVVFGVVAFFLKRESI